MKKIFIILIISLLISCIPYVSASDNLSADLAGKILLQVESNGEAWYVNPSDLNKYYMGRPNDAFNLMGSLGIGITNEDLKKIPIGFINDDNFDDDNDGLSNALEDAIGTDSNNSDTDGDGYSDKTEIENNYSPLSSKKLPIDNEFVLENSGKIFLQVENAGQAWYVNPDDNKRYFLNRPQDAFDIMRGLGLGITNENLDKLTTSILSISPNPIPTPTPDSDYDSDTTPTPQTSTNVLELVAEAVRSNNFNTAVSYFIPELKNSAEYSFNYFDDEARLAFANILSGAKLTSTTADEKIYSSDVYFSLGGYESTVYIYTQKQEDGTWLISKL